jgi:hypothetical protein
LLQLSARKDAVSDAVFSPDGTRIITAAAGLGAGGSGQHDGIGMSRLAPALAHCGHGVRVRVFVGIKSEVFWRIDCF